VALVLVPDFQLPWLNIVVSNFKSIFDKNNKIASPPPGQYNLYSDFDIGKPGGISVTKPHLYSFGASHEVYKNVYIPENPQQRD